MAGKQNDIPGCNSDEMKMIHRLFRRVFSDAVTLTAGVADGDRERAGVVGGFILESAGGLHNHHGSEDLMLWDRLEERRPGCSLHVQLMRRQHLAIGERLAVLEEAVPRWQATASPADREAVLAALHALNGTLLEHLGDEEEQILPVVNEVFTQAEWDAIGEHARKEIPRNRMFVQLGTILDVMQPDERREWVKHNLPLPVQVLYRLVGERQYRTERAKLYGTG